MEGAESINHGFWELVLQGHYEVVALMPSLKQSELCIRMYAVGLASFGFPNAALSNAVLTNSMGLCEVVSDGGR